MNYYCHLQAEETKSSSIVSAKNYQFTRFSTASTTGNCKPIFASPSVMSSNVPAELTKQPPGSLSRMRRYMDLVIKRSPHRLFLSLPCRSGKQSIGTRMSCSPEAATYTERERESINLSSKIYRWNWQEGSRENNKYTRSHLQMNRDKFECDKITHRPVHYTSN